MVRWIKPDLETKFHIDFDWWERKGRDLRVYLQSHLCPECKVIYTNHRGSAEVDWIDPDTAEVTRVDALWQSLRTHCSQRPDFITEHTPLTDAVFRVFLANGNQPLSATELHEILGRRLRSEGFRRTPKTILRTLGGRRVYKGIRPVLK
ncbi:MAG: hypothetical protein KAW49_09410 [Anaerolineae bacterium]|nr:hypothetical protein [Anaerolineae bacterium]